MELYLKVSQVNTCFIYYFPNNIKLQRKLYECKAINSPKKVSPPKKETKTSANLSLLSSYKNSFSKEKMFDYLKKWVISDIIKSVLKGILFKVIGNVPIFNRTMNKITEVKATFYDFLLSCIKRFFGLFFCFFK